MRNYIKSILPALLVAGLALGTSSCVKDLDISSDDPQSTPTFNQDEVFVKQYALLGLTGQRGAAGSPDLDGQDEGESGFYRTIFNCNELVSDELAWAWQDNVGIPELTYINWNSSTQRVEWLYVRLGYDITQLNYFLDQTEGKTDEKSLRQRAEVRFLRALHYAYFLDFFGKAPFKEHFDNTLPVEKGGADLYNFIQTELSECEGDMSDPGQAEFGRADKAANWLLRARLYLNAGVYTGTPDWDNARKYADQVIQSAYKLSPSYEQLFMADNDENASAMQEIILPIRQDGLKTRNFGGSQMLINGSRTSGMPRVGVTGTWSCIFAREALIKKFFPTTTPPMVPADASSPLTTTSTDAEIDAFDVQYNARTVDMIAAAKDDRALFYAGAGGGIRKLSTDKISTFTDGISVVKWQNIRSDGGKTSDTGFPDTDIPLFRLAEAYMTRAEAYFRLGQADLATDDVNVLRRRAHATEFNTNVTEQNLIDEWAREFYMEGRRRSDLIRFGMFTTTKYLWDWKGGTKDGSSVPSFYNRYPIPASDLNNNSNMTQNPGY
jgi:hypothetical protein